MEIPQKMAGSYGTIRITPAGPNDLAEILALFDETVAWLVSHGMERQWGTTPFSESPRMCERFMAWINQRTLFAARNNSLLVGTLVVSETAPEYVAHLWQNFPTLAFYLEAFTTARSLAGQGIGHGLLQWAELYARQANKSTLWLDCWADNPLLCRYYLQAGFTPHEEFFVGEWRGQLFEKQLSPGEASRV